VVRSEVLEGFGLSGAVLMLVLLSSCRLGPDQEGSISGIRVFTREYLIRISRDKSSDRRT